jgi:hypothetical protein
VEEAVGGVKVHGHAQQNDGGGGQLAGTLLAGPALVEDLADDLRSEHPGEGIERERTTWGGVGSTWRILSGMRWLLLGDEGWWFFLHLTKRVSAPVN